MMKKLLFIFVILSLVGTVNAAHPLPTDLTNGSGLIEGMGDWAYQVTNGWFWTLLFGCFCVVLFMATSVYSTDRAFGFAGVTAIFGSIMLTTIGLMSWWMASLYIITGVISLAIMRMANRG